MHPDALTHPSNVHPQQNKQTNKQEITIHHTLRRQFWWYEGQLFLDEVRCPAFIGLSGNDEIVPSDTLRVRGRVCVVSAWCVCYVLLLTPDTITNHPTPQQS